MKVEGYDKTTKQTNEFKNMFSLQLYCKRTQFKNTNVLKFKNAYDADKNRNCNKNCPLLSQCYNIIHLV